MILIATAVLVTIIVAIYLLFQVPLVFTLFSRFERVEHKFSKIGGYWGPFGIKFMYEDGEKIILFLFVDYTVFSHKFKDVEIGSGFIHAKTKAILQSDTKKKGLSYHLETLQQILFFLKNISSGSGNFLKKIVYSTRFRSLETNIKFGTGDPASTGCLFGFFSSVRPFFSRYDKVNLIFSPDFDEVVFEGDIKVALILKYPITLFLMLFSLTLSKNNWLSLINIGRRFS